MGKKAGGFSKDAQVARMDEQARQDRIRTGTDAINKTFDSQFTDPYYDQRRNAYTAFANPQIEDQVGEARRQLIYSLARAGTGNSSIAASKEAELQKTYDQGRQQVADKANAMSGEARTQVEDARTGLVNALNASGDNSLTANSALARAKAVSEPEAYSPIGQIFSQFTGALGTQFAAERAAALSGPDGYKSPYNFGLYKSTGDVKLQK